MIKALAFRTLFGGKPWYNSFMGWGLFVLIVTESIALALKESGVASAELVGSVTYYTERLSILLGAIGIRRQLPANKLLPVLCACLVMGCGTSKMTFMDANNKPVTIEHKIGGRGCVACDSSADGMSCVMQQDASSDWAGIRVIPTLAKAIISAILPAGLGNAAPSFDGPSDIGGCDGLFGGKVEPDDS